MENNTPDPQIQFIQDALNVYVKTLDITARNSLRNSFSSSSDETNKLFDYVKELIDKVNSIDLNLLTYTSEVSRNNILNTIREHRNDLQFLDKLSTYDALNSINSNIKSFLEILDTEMLSNVDKTNNKESTVGELNRLRSISNAYKEELENSTNYRINQIKEFDAIKEDFKSDVNKLKDDNSKLFSELQLIRQQSNFYEVAIAAKKNSNNWVWGIGISFALIIGFGCYFSQSFICDFDDYVKTRIPFFQSQEKMIFYLEIGKRLLFKALIITILLTLLRFSIKNYNAARHIYTVNMHKSSCFGAVYDISRAITDATIRSTLINLAGKEIFAQSKSGYLSNEETKLDLKFLEKISAVFNKKSEEV